MDALDIDSAWVFTPRIHATAAEAFSNGSAARNATQTWDTG